MPGRKSPGVFVFQLFDEIDLCDNRGVDMKRRKPENSMITGEWDDLYRMPSVCIGRI